MEHHYELILIVDGNRDETESQQEFSRVGETVTQYQGTLGEIQPWGKRKLAYEIRGRREGYYASVFFTGGAKVLAELDRGLKLNENVLRHLMLRREPGSTPPPPALDSAGAATEAAPAETRSAEPVPSAAPATIAAEPAPSEEPVTPAPGA